MNRADELRRVLTGLRFSREWEPKLVLQVLDASPDTAVRLWAFFWLARFGYRDARVAFVDLFQTCSGEWFEELRGMTPAERLIAALLTMRITGAPPPSGAEREAMLALISASEELFQRRLDRIAEEEVRQGWEFSTDQLLRRLDGAPLPDVLNIWEGAMDG